MIERSDVVEDGRVTQVELSGYPPLYLNRIVPIYSNMRERRKVSAFVSWHLIKRSPKLLSVQGLCCSVSNIVVILASNFGVIIVRRNIRSRRN
jgi:hypothetical protein